MKIIKVNNIKNFFFYRYLILIFFCFITIFVTGRIADMDILLGWVEYTAGGTTSKVALSTFSLFKNFGDRYLVVAILGIIFSLILYFIIKSLIDKENQDLWKLLLLAPGLLIYTNAPTKESLFLYPAILFIILECNYLIGKNSQSFFNFFTRISLLILLFSVRGDQALPYVLLSLISLILRNINIGVMTTKIKFSTSIIFVFFLSILTIISLSLIFPEYIENLSNYLNASFLVSNNLYRPNNFDAFNQPFNVLSTQYLSLFPSLQELLFSPYKAVIILDSLLLIYVFIKSWSNLFNIVNSYKYFKKITLVYFTFITMIYFSIYGIIGSVNLGSSQRLRVNFIPLGIIFPLIIEKKLRDRKKLISINKI